MDILGSLSAAVDSFKPAPRAVILRRLKWIGAAAAILVVLWAAGFGVIRAFAGPEVPQADCLKPCTGDQGVVVLVHGWTGSPEKLRPLAERMRQIKGFENYQFHLWAFDAGRLSNQHPAQLAKGFVQDVRKWALPDKPVVLVGHSTGGLIV